MSERALDGRVAVVTGGGRGIGRALALALVDAGSDVVLAARSAPQIEAVAAEARHRGRRALAVPTDVTRPDDVDRLIEQTVGQLGRVDVLVNNSGIADPAPFLELDPQRWDDVIATNLRGTYLCTRAAGRHFVDAGAGKVINVASIFGLKGRPNYSSYAASKAAILGLTRALAVEWAPLGVQVNAIAPGFVATDINAEARADEQARQRIERQIPAGRIGDAEELGALAVYLASPASDYVTGTTICVDGGWHAR